MAGCDFNPFSHSGHCIGPPSKLSILVSEGIMEKIHMSLAPMSRKTIRTYPSLYHKKLWKIELVTLRVKQLSNFIIVNKAKIYYIVNIY